MKNRRDFLRNTLGLGAGLAASRHLFAASQESGAGMDMKHMDHVAERGNSRMVSVETPDVAQLPWHMDGSVKEFNLIAEPVKQEIFPGRVVDLWGYNGSAPGPTIQVNQGDRVRIIVDNHLPEATCTGTASKSRARWTERPVRVKTRSSPVADLSTNSRSTRKALISTTRTWRCKK